LNNAVVTLSSEFILESAWAMSSRRVVTHPADRSGLS